MFLLYIQNILSETLYSIILVHAGDWRLLSSKQNVYIPLFVRNLLGGVTLCVYVCGQT